MVPWAIIKDTKIEIKAKKFNKKYLFSTLQCIENALFFKNILPFWHP
jgi:hypothetical protein